MTSNYVKLHDSLGSAEAVVSSTSVNEHFSVPHGAEKLYTGRSNVLIEVKSAFATDTPGATLGLFQKRIVIYGLGGSGKTQFCCEYAQRYRHWLVKPLVQSHVQPIVTTGTD